MVITWQRHDEHTGFGLFRVGDVIDTAARGIPDEVVGPWIRDGYAVEVKADKPEPPRAARSARKKANR